MKIDRRKIVNRCGYDQNECMLLAKRLAACPDDTLISELKQINVWNYGKCELGLWVDVLDRLDAILENAVTKVGRWMLRLDLPENASLVDDVVTILEFTGHLIEHSIYRYLYGSWNHILALFGSENMDILLAVLGLAYNFSKRSNYFVRLDHHNKKMILERLVSIAETWGGSENNFGLAACCDPDHFPETAGNIYFEYRPDSKDGSFIGGNPPSQLETETTPSGDVAEHTDGCGNVEWTAPKKIILRALHRRNQSPSQIMEELLSQHLLPPSKQMALFARIRLATYFAIPEQRHKCIRARLQALSILSYTFDVDERHLYPSLLDELVEVLELPDGQYTGIKACALRTMTAIVNSHRLGITWTSLVSCTGLSSYHGILPSLTRRWIQGLVDGTIEAPGGSTNQQFTTAILSFLYHLACYEENVGPGNTQNATLSSSGVLDTMLQLIAWHTPRNDCLSYVTRAVRVTDQILMSIATSRLNVVNILVNRLSFEVDLVLKASTDGKIRQDVGPALNTQRSGLMKSILNLLKRLCLDTDWGEVMHTVMEDTLPDILRQIFLNGSIHFTPHLALFAMETITNYLYTYPSRISSMQDKNVTTDILTALTSQPLPQNRDFLVQLPGLFNTLALNARGIEAIQSSGVLSKYLETLVSPDYLPTMKTKRVRDFLSQISYNLSSSTGQSLSNSLTASQMSNAIQELLRSRSELKTPVFQGLVACMKRVVEIGRMQPASLVVEPIRCISDTHTLGTDDNAKLSNEPADSTVCEHLGSDLPCLTGVALGRSIGTSQAATSTSGGRSIGETDAMLEEDVVMLSGDEDEDGDDDHDIDDVSRATQTAAHQHRSVNTRLMDSRSTSPTASLNLKEDLAPPSRPITSLADGSPVPAYHFLSDFMLNTCKFLEKLLPSVLHVTEAMCRHFMSHGGLQVLCDLLRMPGLPYDFPVSASCASLCKIFEDLANSIYLNDVIAPLFQCLESSLEKLAPLQNSQFTLTSLLLREYMANEHVLLHELVVTASIICIMVQIIDHLKSELRPSLADKWLVRNVLHSLGRLYLGVSWEACILLRILYGDKDITEADICPQERMDTSVHPQTSCTANRNQASDGSGWKPEDDTTGQWRPVTETSPMPQFVEALHIYSILRPSKIPASGDNKSAFLHQRPELAKATHRILHVTAFLINSVTELCTSWSRFFANRNQLNYRRRRMTLLPSEQIPTARKYAALSEISQVISGALAWEPAATTTHHPAAPTLICAMRYSSIRLTNVLLHDASQKGPQGGMMNVFFMLNGIRRYFGLFKELVKFDLTDPKVRTSLTETLEEWLVCADRMSSTEYINTELARSSDNETTVVDPERYIKEVHRCMLFPLNQLCIRKDLQNLLTRRAVEHLLSMLVTIVPYLFKAASKPSSPAPACSMPPVLPAVIHPDTPTLVPTVTTLSTEDTIMDVSDSGTAEPELDGRTRVNIRLLEEMGFSREVAVVALEQTEGDVNEAVNLLVSTPAEELLATAATVRSSRSATLQRRDTVEQPTQESSDSSVTRSASAIAAAAMELASVASSLLSSAESPLNHLNAVISQRTTGERLRSSTQQPIPSLPSSLKIPFDWQKPLSELEPLAPEKIEELRESLKKHVFRACYSIAKHHHSDQILHRIAELLLSSGEEEHYIDELFGFVAATMSGRLGFSVASPTIPSLSVNVDEAGVSVQEQPTVGLHLSALLFSRCQSLCARLAWKHNLPHLLITWVARCEQSADRPPDSQPANHGLDVDYYKTLLLSCLILDLYERSIQAMQLRQISSKLYLNSHTWNWFDDRAMLWHPYASESGRIIDTAFHNGELSAYCHISRRPYAVEFPTMTQINLDSMHRRPVLLMPSTTEDTDERSNKESAYERSILDAEIPPKLTDKQRKTLFTGLVHQFERATTQSAITQTTVPLCEVSCPTNVHASPVLLPSDCVNAMLRLLLRLAYSSFDDAREMIDVNLLSVLLGFPHSRDFTAEYSAFVGSIVIQMFEDRPTVNRTMKEVIRKMCKFGLPSSFMGVRINSPACRDLFYLLSMCAPIMAKDRETALKIACDTINLSLSDADVTAKTVPKDYIVEAPVEPDDKDQDTFLLSDRQQAIITQLIEVIMQPSKTVDNRTNQSAIVDTSQRTQSSTSDGIHTSASTLLTSNSTVSDATWSSGLNLAGLPSQHESQSTATAQPSASLPTNATTGSCPTTNVAVLGKADVIRYLIDLIASYRPVAEFVATYKHKPCGTSAVQFPSLLTYLFSTQLSNPETTDLTTYLLENLVLVGCESTQDIIIAEYKASLGRISSSVPVSGDQGIGVAYESVQFHKNERVTAHMAFLERLLALPSPLVDRLIGLIYRRHLPADIAKLIALVDCNLPNTQSTLSTTLRTLESLTWVDRQINKLLNSTHERQTDQPLPGSAVQEAQEGQVIDSSQRPEHPTTMVASTEGHSRLVAGGVREAHISTHVNSTGHASEGVERPSGVHQFDSNSEDDDDEDDHNDNLVHRSTYRVEGAVAGGQTSTSSALNIVLDNVLMTDAGLVINQPRVTERDVPQPWHAGEQDGSVIFVRDDEDEGSAGQGGEDDNSQDEDGLDVDDEVDGGDDDEEVEDEDNDEDEEDGDEDDDEDDDDDGGGETDEDVIADDGEVALVLRSGSSGRHLRGSRRPRTETISLSVTTSRAGGEPEPTASAGEAVRANFQRGADELNIHGDTHEEDDGSFDDDDVDTFGRDDEDGDDIEMPGPDSEGPVFLSTDSRMLRENDSVVAVVEEVLNLVDLPHQTTSTVVSRGAGGRRDRFIFTPSEFGGLNIIPSRNSGGNWGLFLPRFGGAINSDNHVRNASAGTGLPPNTTIFRFGIGNGGNTSVFVTDSNQRRLNSSGVSITSPGNASATPAAQHSIVPLTLSSQHPILQVPSFTLANQAGAVGAGPNTNIRVNGSVVTNAAPTPFTNRVTSVLPPIPPVSNTVSSTQYGYRLRIPTGVPPPTVGNDSFRNRVPPARAHTPFMTESVGYRPYTTNVSAASTSAATSSLISHPQSTAAGEAVRDARAGPEADALVWNVLCSVAVDQPLPVNSALASAVFRTDEPAAIRTSSGLSSTQLSPYAGYALPASYRRWVTLSRLLFGHELMDLVLISRYHVHQEVSRRRQDTLKRRILEAERLANQQQAAPAATPSQPEVASSAVTSNATVESQQPEGYDARAQMETSHVSTPPISHQPLVEHTLQYSQPDEGTAASQMDTAALPPSIEASYGSPTVAEDTAPGISEEPVQATTTISTGGTGQPTQTQPAPPPVPMTDEETIQSLVESGMDPSFLDALPEEMRREVIADHRHARQVQQQLRSIALPEHINSDWLAGLPPHIQEEVLLQFRNEQQQNAAAAASGANTTATSGAVEGAATTVSESGSTVRVPESNTAFLISLPPSLRREVLADMEESQLEMLPPDLVAEARQLRRESEERFARAVQGGMLAHSFTSRHDRLIGGPGRWDVRFSSINHFLRHLNSLAGPFPPNTSVGLHNLPGIRGRHLVDYEGLTCLLALLVASSSCSQQRRQLIPTVKKVLRNLSCHFATRNWIVGTLLCIFGGLSENCSKEKPSLESAPSLTLEPQSSISVAQHDSEVKLPRQSKPSVSNNIFHTGFEAALGCWVRVFHPVSQPIQSFPPETEEGQSKTNQESDTGELLTFYCEPTPGTSATTTRNHMIHPQAAAAVSNVLLDTLGDLAKAFPAHFYPRLSGDHRLGPESSEPLVPPHKIDWPRPPFWEIFDRLSESAPVLGSISSSPAHPRFTRRPTHGSARKRHGSTSHKQQTSTAPRPTPMDVSLHGTKTHPQDQLPDTGTRAEVDEPAGSCRKRLTSSWASVDYFFQMADLLCHPLLQNRPSNQERVLTILAGILKEFIINRGRMEEQTATTGQTVETAATLSQPSEQLEQAIPPEAVVGQPESSSSGVQEPTKTSSTCVPPDFVGSIRPEALKTLCEFVCSPKSTESGRSMAAQLITDLAHTNRDMKELMLNLLAESLNTLTSKLTIQLQEFSDELTSQLKSDAVISLKQKERGMKPSSSISRLVSMDVLPDRFSSSGQTVVVSGGDSRPNPATAFCDLQLKSIQAFTCPNNEQSRLRGIVGLMVRLTAGECSLNANGSVSVSNQDPFASITSLSEFWPKLSSVFEKLQKCPDMNAVLLLQPLLEAFCLAHLHLVKDSIMIRQRSATSRTNRPTITVTASGAHSLVDMIPMLQVRVDSSTPSASERDEVREPSINENTTHLQLDVMGPVSPPTLSTEDEKAFGDDATGCRRGSSNSATSNAILQFAEQHRIGLNQVLRQHGGSLGESPFAVFLAYPRVLDFDIKRRFFRQQLQALSHRSPLSNRYDDEPILISRDRLFEDSYARLHRKSPAEWKHKFVIRFHNEEGQDAGGPLREWYLLMSREIFNPNYCLFRTSPADRVTYTINPSSYINSNHLSYFKFVGRFIAKAIYDSKLLECYFSRAFYKHILGVPVKCSDLESEDYDFYKGLEFLLKNHVSDLGYELTFSTEINEFGKTETRDLIENGRNVPVTEQNKKEYVRLVCQERMTGAIRQQLDAFLAGFYEIIPKRMISIFNEQELELLISGLPNIDIGDLKANTTYSKYHPNSPQIEWFWCALESFDQEDRARFLQFVTGTSKVPLGGFANLEGMHGPTKFQISRASVSSTNHLPCAHTCFNTLVLPAYETYEQLRTRLLTAIRECSEGYGMA